MATVSFHPGRYGEPIVYLEFPGHVHASTLEAAEEFANAIIAAIAEIRSSTAAPGAAGGYCMCSGPESTDGYCTQCGNPKPPRR